jgi:inhibitor of cysteine peptidase
MKKFFWLIILIAILGAGVMLLRRYDVNLRPSPQPTPEEKTKAEIIVAKEGEDFSIVLGSNFSTGYQWQFDYDSAYIELVDKKFEQAPHEPGMVGFGETGTYIFKGLKKGITQITATYLRPWEKDTPPMETKIYKVTIK